MLEIRAMNSCTLSDGEWNNNNQGTNNTIVERGHRSVSYVTSDLSYDYDYESL